MHLELKVTSAYDGNEAFHEGEYGLFGGVVTMVIWWVICGG